MEKEVIIAAANTEKAIEMALAQLGAKREEVEIEVLEEPSKKLFGGTTNAKVKVCITTGGSNTKETGEHASSESEGLEKGESERLDKDADYDHKDKEVQGHLDQKHKNTDELHKESFNEAAEDRYLSDEDEMDFNKATVKLTDDELDTIADAAIETIRELIRYFGVGDADIDEYEGEDGELILDIVGDNLAVLIGRHGKTIDAIQFLVSSIVSKKTGYRHPVVIDVKGYKHRRKQKIVSIAKASAARAIRQRHEVRLRPMTPFERRIVHIALREDKRITTVSEGIEPNRHVIIKLK